ncbi:two-component system sensor histidine kinase NtrB [Treponema endosymbiont of Eucomonympha sp.]|uniref:two-component system sensor histidine kinase NtrB n=1 Tax=Treponema endosymbiont of Eucomonympha sp. TaxID=1580831 RepID=UPI000750DCB2|nr:ATP-binding protein [Treponema endosymbiont of Eucomonympha sp.]
MNGFVKRVSTKISKLSGEQIEQVIDAISEENEIRDAILGSLSTGLIVCDENGLLYQTNKAAERLVPFAKNPGDPRVGDVPVWELIADADVAAFVKSLWEKQRNNVSRDFALSAPGGATRRITLSAMALVRGKKMTGTILKIDDVTEKFNQELRLRRMENLAGLTNVAANVAHEIKNPLGSISIHIQLIQKALVKARGAGGLLPGEKFLERYLGIVNEEIERLNKIVVDFLYAVRPVRPVLALTNPDEALKKAAEFLRPELSAKRVELKLSLAPECPDLLLDEKLFRQVILNLAKNAVAALPDGGILAFSSRVRHDRYILTVADNGHGMEPETAARIFEPYFTTKADGTGLGMTMAYKIIREFLGDIDVKSIAGEGTAVVISLPLPQSERRLLEGPATT